MRKLLKVFLSAFLIFNQCFFGAAYATENVEKEPVYSKQQIKEDVEFMMNTMENVHPNLYFAASKEEMKKEIDKELNSIDKPLTGIEVYRKFAPIVSELQDGHTWLATPQDYMKKIYSSDKMLFIGLKIRDGKMYIKDTFKKEYDKYKDWELISINGKQTSKIYNQISKYISCPVKAFKEAAMIRRFTDYYHTDNELKSEYSLKIRKDGKEEIIKLKGMNMEQIEKINTKKEGYQDYSYKKLNDNTGLITFNVFRDFDKFKKFLDETFKKINKDHISNLIIDLRNNGGGNSRLGDLLIEYIYDGKYKQADRMDVKVSNKIIEYYKGNWKKQGMSEKEIKESIKYYTKHLGKVYTSRGPASRHFTDKPKFKGESYFLIGRYTFSSAVMLASTVKDYKIGYLIGEETGGLPTEYGDIYWFKLPNTGLATAVSHKYFVRPNGLDTKRGVIPDYSINDLGNKDALDIALEIIKNKSYK
ncbi:S41 family peptidase [Clostridium aestuarii]|uniref:S41 family peptidase n=1 Tax=Clostridium aestuarii TaxID=338193 RepID=A0ABT4D0T2_9CLOT|nr:S41 family peptidase [Clostridium aestuarii]MCY6484707.1 S41 family peptidase [Clostridium aestuarii]